MVAMFETAFLIVCAVLGIWWFRRTSMYRARVGSGAEQGHSEAGARASLAKLPPKHGYDGGGGGGG